MLFNNKNKTDSLQEKKNAFLRNKMLLNRFFISLHLTLSACLFYLYELLENISVKMTTYDQKALSQTHF